MAKNIQPQSAKRKALSKNKIRGCRVAEFPSMPLWTDDVGNLVAACRECNNTKSDRTPEEMGWVQ